MLLKRDYLRLMRKQRVDVLIHILVDQVEPDLRRQEAQIRLGFEAPHLQKHEKASKKLANTIETGELKSMVEYYEDGQDKVCFFFLFIIRHQSHIQFYTIRLQI